MNFALVNTLGAIAILGIVLVVRPVDETNSRAVLARLLWWCLGMTCLLWAATGFLYLADHGHRWLATNTMGYMVLLIPITLGILITRFLRWLEAEAKRRFPTAHTRDKDARRSAADAETPSTEK